jgi:lauroyl/myristoyl acyltransferase
MRHHFFAGTHVAHPDGMLLLATAGLLIAFACLPERLATRLSGAVAETVDLPAVAVTAHDHFDTALPAKEQTARPRLALRIVADAA